jgi:hypothetical protein
MSVSQANSVVTNDSSNEKGKSLFYLGKNKRLFELLYDICPQDSTYIICKLCPEGHLKKRKKKGSGYQNAINHLKIHKGFEYY